MKIEELVTELRTLGAELKEQVRAGRAELAGRAKEDPAAARVLRRIEEGPGVLQRDADAMSEHGAGLKAARLMRAFACARGNVERMPNVLADTYRDKALAEEFHRSMTASVAEDGGLWLAEAFSRDVIPLLLPKTVLFPLGAQTYPMSEATEHIPTLDAGTSAYWVGEVKAPNATQVKTGRKTLHEKYAAAKVPISNTLLKSANVAADRYVLNDVLQRLALLIDKSGFEGTGTDFSPRGLKNSGIQTLSVNALPTGDTVVAFIEKLMSKNVPMVSPGQTFNTVLWRILITLKDKQDRYLFRDEMARGTLFGIPFKVNNQIATATSGKKNTDWYMGDFNEFLVGDRGGMQVEMSREAAYTDAAGQMQSAFENRETVILASLPTDFMVRQNDAFVLSDDVNTIA